MASTLPSSARKPRKKPPSSLTVPSIHLDVPFGNIGDTIEPPTMDTGTRSKKEKTQIPVKINKTPTTIYKNPRLGNRPNRLGSSSSTSSTTPSVQSLENSKSREPSENNHSLEGVLQVPGTPSFSRMSAGSDSRNRGTTRGTTPKTPRKSPKPFEQYLPLEEVQRGLKKGELIEGVLRINPKNYEDAYISAPDGQMDIYIGGLLDRNRSFNGDVVAVKLHPQNKWKVLLDNIRDYEAKHSVSPSPSPSRKPSDAGDEKKLISPPSTNVSQDPETDSSGKKKKKKRGKKKKLSADNETVYANDSEEQQTLEVDLPESPKIKNLLLKDLADGGTSKRCKPRKRNKSNKQVANDPCDQVLIAAITSFSMSNNEVEVKPNAALNGGETCAEVPENSTESTGTTDVDDEKQENSANQETQSVVETIVTETTETDREMINANDLSKHDIGSCEDSLLASKQQPLCFDSETTTDSDAKKQTKTAAIHELPVENILQHPCGHKFVQKTGKVVSIVESKHPRIAIGRLKLMQDKNSSLALFVPNDHRIPRMKVPMSDCPSGFATSAENFENLLFYAQVSDWKNTGLADGKVLSCVGAVGNINAESEAILLENSIDFEPFPEHVLREFRDSQWTIPEDELAKRKDLRDECIFTIDPETAKDLDDAVSCVKLDNGTYHIGVHIADVSYFVKEFSPADLIAQKRTTTVYLVQEAITMLPPMLCDNLCSLRPSQDRLCMSVMWHLSEDGSVLDEWFGRTVIHSCAQLSYAHAQGMIEDPDRDWKPEELPQMHGKYSIRDISNRVVQLHLLAKKLKQKRVDNGALRLDQLKMQFAFQDRTDCPSGFSLYIQKGSNSLIEEFMLLANMAVAHKLLKAHPNNAILRCHPPPNDLMMEEIVHMCEAAGIHLDVSSSKTIQDKLLEIGSKKIGDTDQTILPVLAHFLSKPMQRAKYFCTCYEEDPSQYHHYALSVPLYTHFTSPIRRYPDVMVHRLLGAALGLNPDPKSLPSKEIKKLMERCNDKKWAAKIVSELSQELYLALFLKEHGPITSEAVVVGVLDQAFDVLILKTGSAKRIYLKQLPGATFKMHKEDGLSYLTIDWEAVDNHAATTQMIMLFALVTVTLVPEGTELLKYSAELNRPQYAIQK